MSRLIDADRLLTDRMKSKYYHLPNGDIAIPLIDIEHAPTITPEPKWIPVSERLPEKPNMYTVTDSKGDVVRFVFNDTESSREYWLRCAKAWMPLPEPYREEGD